MVKKTILASLGVFLILAVVLMAATGGGHQFQNIDDPVTIQPPASRAACTLNKATGAITSFWNSYEAGVGTYTYYDPAVECASDPTYPFEILSFGFTLYDNGGAYTWPAYVDVVVYDLLPSGNPCDGPGDELCRMSVIADQASFGYPTMGNVAFSFPCCVNGPFFMGLEYTAGQTEGTPSILFDDNPAPDTCDNWLLSIDGLYQEWYDFWSPPPPGYPVFVVNGDTESPNCEPQICDWQPGDPYKHHFPQYPDETGWAVNATQPMILAEDFMCMETGWIKDFHFWGAWKNEDIGIIQSFVLSIHEDIPAEQNPDGYSKPGLTLWELDVDQFDFAPVDPPTMEGWYDPATGEVIPDDHYAYWQYNICLSEPDWFWQDSGTIYWVNISAIVDDPTTTTWGWKSTQDHWNDDAVWAYWGELAWIDIWEPTDPILNEFWIAFDPTGMIIPAQTGGIGYYPPGDVNGWWLYAAPDWEFWNIWFYDHPFTYDRQKKAHIEFDVYKIEPEAQSWLTFVVNYSTDLWSLEGQPPGDSIPPLPGLTPELELMYIGRDTLYDGPVDLIPGHFMADWEMKDYNPEWISIDVWGYNFIIPEPTGMVFHDCIGSLDLSLVVTNGEEPHQEGACCDTVGNCYITDALTCANNGHLYEGDGTTCTPNPCDTCDYQYPGDVNLDGIIDVHDLTYLVSFLYQGGPPPPVLANADVNGDCCIDWRDVKYLMEYLFMGGPAPVYCTCIYPPICIDPPADYTPGDVKHNTDGYNPSNGNPIGSHWHELYDNFCTDWDLTSWIDNGDGYLSFCDTVVFSKSLTPLDTIREHIKLVTTTILVGTSTIPCDTMYLDLIDPPNPMNNPITDPWGTQWHEVYPDYCNIWQIVYCSGGTLVPGDNITLQALSGPDSTSTRDYDVITIETDIVTEPASCCVLRGDVALPKDVMVLVNDIVWLVDYIFKGGAAPLCLEEGDCAIPLDGTILVNDIVWLVDYIFKGGAAPPPC